MAGLIPTVPLTRLKGLSAAVHAITYSTGIGQYLLTGSADGHIRLFNPSRVEDPSPIQTYSAHGYEVLDLAVNSDNSRFASVGGDKAVFVWDVAVGGTIRRYSGHVARINAVAWGPEDSVIASGSYDGTVRLWDLKSQSHKPLMVLSEAQDSISSVLVKDHQIIAGSIDGKVRVYDIRMGLLYVDVIGHPVTSVRLTAQDDSILVSSLDSSIRLIDKSNGKLLQTFKAESYVNTEYRVRSVFGVHGEVVISGDESASIFIWNVLDGTLLHTLSHSKNPDDEGAIARMPPAGKKKTKQVISAVTYCDSKREWASAGGDGTVVVWGLA